MALRYGKPVSQVLREHTSAELTELMTYERLYGSIGDDRIDLLIGVLTSVIANIHRDRKAPPFIPLDFMPFHGEEREIVKVKQRRRRSEELKSKLGK